MMTREVLRNIDAIVEAVEAEAAYFRGPPTKQREQRAMAVLGVVCWHRWAGRLEILAAWALFEVFFR